MNAPLQKKNAARSEESSSFIDGRLKKTKA
jgi:hypothetical protein